jgi:hypothetical protein
MEMFLMGLCLSFLGVVVSGVLFAAATREERERQMAYRPEERLVLEPPRFFVQRPAAPASPVPVRIPLEVLLLQIERHVRLEQAAAESFHDFPTVEALHVQTLSPLVH